MPKTKIDLTQNLYDDKGELIKEHQANVQLIMKKIASMDVTSYDSTQEFMDEINRNFSIKEVTIRDYLKSLSLGGADKEDSKIDDFDLFLEIREAKDEIQLEEDKILRLQNKLKKMKLPNLISGQIYYILSGRDNPLKIKDV